MILAGNVALESMGFKTFGFGGGRADVWEPEEDIYWGPEGKWLADERYSGDRQLAGHLGAVQMGLIYVNPEGPNGKPDPLAAARDIRETFARMAMNDEETVALIAGGHTFGKTHGAGDASLVGPEPEGCGIEEQGLGWHSKFGTGNGGDAITSGIEVIWTTTPTKWSNNFFSNLFGYEWELTKSPAGAHQWTAEEWRRCRYRAGRARSVQASLAVDADHRPRLALRPGLREDFKALPRASGSVRRRLCPGLVQADPPRHGPDRALSRPARSKEELLWQDPVPAVDHPLIGEQDIAALKAKILASGLSISQLVRRPGRRRRRSAAPTSAAERTGRAFASRRKRTGK